MPGPFALDGKIVLVTGGSRGLGWGMARAMAAAGAHVVLNGRDPQTLRARADELTAEGSGADAAAFDVTDEGAVVEGLARVARQHGRLDVLVNNAGIQLRKPLVEFTTEEFERIVGTNLTACFVLAREAAKLMIPRKAGRIINTISLAATVVRPTISAYTAAKGGLAALTRALAVELGPHGITANGIAPGYFATEMNSALTRDPAFTAWVEKRTPLGRWGRVDELGGAAVFFASDAASFVTGHILVVDGGLTASM